MRLIPLAIPLAALLAVAGAQAQPPTPASTYAADTKAASERYRADLKLCDDETSPAARLQCRRDAKQEYDRLVGEAKAHRDAASATAATTVAPQALPAACPDCGVVAEVSVTEKAGDSSALGLIAGGVGGALLGHQVGGGTGKDIATIAGAVGGAYAGKKIEEKVKTHKVWSVAVLYAGGSRQTFEFASDPGFKVGDRVRNSGKTIVRQ